MPVFRKRGSRVVAAITSAITPAIGLLNAFNLVNWSEGQLAATMVGVPAIGLGIIGVISAIIGEDDGEVEI